MRSEGFGIKNLLLLVVVNKREDVLVSCIEEADVRVMIRVKIRNAVAVQIER